MRISRRIVLAAVIACLAAVTAAAPAAASLKVDRSFGIGGIVKPQLPGQELHSIIQMAVGPRGAIYLLVCDSSCSGGTRVMRLRADGTPAEDYGSEFGTAPVGGGSDVRIAVDSFGRVVAARVEAGSVVVQRFDTRGKPDPSFGVGGAMRIDCNCLGELILETDGEGRILVGRESSFDFYPPGTGETIHRTEFRLWRLLDNGGLDAGYGTGGEAVADVDRSHGESIFTKASLTRPGGLTLLAGVGETPTIYAQRVTPNGAQDLGFASRTTHALEGLRPVAGRVPSSVTAILPRRKGRFDLVGSTDSFATFILRFRGNGTLDRGFGRDGMRLLPYSVRAVALDRRGRMFAIAGAAGEEGSVAFRLRPNGAFERSGGAPRIVHLKGWEASQSSVAVQRGRHPLVFNTGYEFCRYACGVAHPKLIRFRG